LFGNINLRMAWVTDFVKHWFFLGFTLIMDYVIEININFDEIVKICHSCAGGNPAMLNMLKTLDSRFHGNDEIGCSTTFKEIIIILLFCYS
jgi:hypothetical protein